MATGHMSNVVCHLRRAALLGDAGGLSDGQLLGSFIDRRDEAAFEALVRRHGPMVLGVYRRVLGSAHDAEDAFQATFLVLVQKAASLRSPELLGNWLYGVAHRVARRARVVAARRRLRERQVSELPERTAPEAGGGQDWLRVLDQELNRLSERYRVPVVLCDLQGRTRKEAARHLGLPEGTVSGRLTTARRMLARRLARRGLAPSVGALPAALSQNAAPACVPLPLVMATVTAAARVAAGQATAGLLSAQVAALTEGALKAMFPTKFIIAVVMLLGIGVLASVPALRTHPALAEKPPARAVPDGGKQAGPEVRGLVKAVDAAHHALTLHRSKVVPGEKTFALASDVMILLDDGTGDRLGFRQGKLADLTEGAVVTLRLSGDRHQVVRIWVEGPTVRGILKAVDAANRTLTATLDGKKGEPAADRTFAVAANARLFLDGGKAKDKAKPATKKSLADLPANVVVFLTLSADRMVAGSIRAEGQKVTGVVKGVDAVKNAVTVAVTVKKGQPEVTRTFLVAKDAPVSIDNGKTKDKARPDGLGDLPPGAVVTLRLSLDQRSAVAIRAGGVTAHGGVKAVDAVKSTITLKDKRGDTTYAVAPDAKVFLDGDSQAKKLADVPVNAAVNLKLLAGQKTVREIWATGPTVAGTVKGTAQKDGITIADKHGEKTFAVAEGVRVLTDKTKAGKLTDLIDGTVAVLRLSADQATVLEIRAEGPSFRGAVKAVDSDNSTITLTVGAKNGVGGEDRTFPLTKDTAVVTEIYGAALKLSDLKAGTDVFLRLRLDQKAAARITVRGQ
jgi:RNA polymerase sigma factor (sigma-70 family)